MFAPRSTDERGAGDLRARVRARDGTFGAGDNGAPDGHLLELITQPHGVETEESGG